MRNPIRHLIARLRGRHTAAPIPAAAYEPPPPTSTPNPPRRPRPHEAPLDGEATPLVRPYLLVYEHEAARQDRAFLREMAVAR